MNVTSCRYLELRGTYKTIERLRSTTLLTMNVTHKIGGSTVKRNNIFYNCHRMLVFYATCFDSFSESSSDFANYSQIS
jgi:hypothetical protein